MHLNSIGKAFLRQKANIIYNEAILDTLKVKKNTKCPMSTQLFNIV